MTVPDRVPERSAWKITTLIGFVAVAGYFFLPSSGKDIDYVLVAVGSVGAMAIAIRHLGPAERLGWFAIAAGLVSFVLGDIVHGAYSVLQSGAAPDPSVADAFYVVGYPFLVVGVVRLTRGRTKTGSSRETYADAGIVALGTLALSWQFLMGSYIRSETMGLAAKLVAMAYPVMDVTVLFILVRSIFSGVARHAVLKLLVAGMVSMIVADFFRALLALQGTYAIGNPLDTAWSISYVLLAAAALHPAMAAVPAPVADSHDDRQRLPIVAVAMSVPPVILLVTAVTGAETDVVPQATMSILLLAMVVVRMWWMFRRISSQNTSLERSLEVGEALKSELRHRAFHDGLTGLANRELLYDLATTALTVNPRPRGTVAVCVCDLDGFRVINDRLGHLVGDAVLIAAGKRLRAVVRPGDIVARIGADELAVLMTDLEDVSVATAVAERIVAVLRQPVQVQSRRIPLSVSVGVAVTSQNMTAELLISQAGSAVGEAKTGGGDRLAVFDESMQVRSAERLELSNGFAGALERRELFVEYQPQYSLRDGELEGFEALVRWQHPNLGLVGPDRFVPLAERTGHIVAIGRWVLEEACRQAGKWSRAGAAPLIMAVNLSGRQLQDPHLLADVRAALARGRVAPQQLVLEITEGVLVVDTERTLRVLTELKAMGIQLAIDDFGTGYSSLSYLRRLPVDVLKIDKSFVDPLGDPTGEGAAFISMIVQLAHSLGLRTIAEGIEHPDQRAALETLGCDSAQGFLLGRPLGHDAATRLIEAPVPEGRQSVPAR